MPPYSMPLTSTPFFKKRPPLFYNKKDQKKVKQLQRNLAQLPQGRHHHPRLFGFSAWRFLSPSLGLAKAPRATELSTPRPALLIPSKAPPPRSRPTVTGTVVVSVYGQWSEACPVNGWPTGWDSPTGSCHVPQWVHPNINSHSNNGKMSELWVGNAYHLYMYIYIYNI